MATTETTEIKKPVAYQSTWQDQLKDIANRILNREKFSYDFNADPLYNQYKSQYVNQGRMAMMDTMGQAAAMTGGYGNSYAQGVGQQAFNGYLQQMNNIIPELYQLALSKHQMEGDELTSKFAVLGAQDDKDYGRYRDTMSDYYLDQEFAYQKDRDKVADSQWQAEFDEAVRQFNFANKLGEFAPVASSGGGGGSSKSYSPKKKTDDPEEPEVEDTSTKTKPIYDGSGTVNNAVLKAENLLEKQAASKYKNSSKK